MTPETESIVSQPVPSPSQREPVDSVSQDAAREAAQTEAKETDREALQRALRDLEATEARVKRNAEKVYDESRIKLVMDLLPVLDNLDRTLEAAETSSDPVLIEGLRMVRSQLESVLIRYGVERVEASGQRFDPKDQEAISMVDVADAKLVGTVVKQVTPGYRFNGRVLRAAKVLVGAPMPAPKIPVPEVPRSFGLRPNRFY